MEATKPIESTTISLFNFFLLYILHIVTCLFGECVIHICQTLQITFSCLLFLMEYQIVWYNLSLRPTSEGQSEIVLSDGRCLKDYMLPVFQVKQNKTSIILTVLALSDREVADRSFRLILFQTHREDLSLKSD